MKILAVTACPTGIAHTYMAADTKIFISLIRMQLVARNGRL